tara:strand:- start:2039 stop:2485 length:447 start_codon:yes stop_codon:yes gene_type:complete
MPRGKKECPNCKALSGVRTSTCKGCGEVFPKKEKKTKPDINKRDILHRLLDVPSSNKQVFYMREMKLLNNLCDKYSLEFMNIMTFTKKLDSLTYFTSPKLKQTLDQKFRAFNYSLDRGKYVEYDLGCKVGEDKAIFTKNKTIKDFLNE